MNLGNFKHTIKYNDLETVNPNEKIRIISICGNDGYKILNNIILKYTEGNIFNEEKEFKIDYAYIPKEQILYLIAHGDTCTSQYIESLLFLCFVSSEIFSIDENVIVFLDILKYKFENSIGIINFNKYKICKNENERLINNMFDQINFTSKNALSIINFNKLNTYNIHKDFKTSQEAFEEYNSRKKEKTTNTISQFLNNCKYVSNKLSSRKRIINIKKIKYN
jgi:hypothetical protein